MKAYRIDGSPYPEGPEGTIEWAKDIQDFKFKSVRRTNLWNGMMVSTVWLGLDHNFWGEGPPLIFETMVFDPFASKHRMRDLEMDRYSTLAEAQVGHRLMCKKVSSIWYTIKYWWSLLSEGYEPETGYYLSIEREDT